MSEIENQIEKEKDKKFIELDDENPHNPNDLIDRIIDDLGMHKYNLIMIFIISFTFLCDGIESLTVVLIIPAFKEKYNIGMIENSILVACPILGVSLGNFIFGFFHHHFGEKKPFILSNFFLITFTILSICYDNFVWFCFFRFLVGGCVGVNVNYGNGLFEILPSKIRGFMTVFVFITYDIGIIFFTFLFYYYTLDQSEVNVYKTIIVISSLPILIPLILGIVYYQESPRRLAWEKDFDTLFNNIDKYAGTENYLSEEIKEKLKNSVDLKLKLDSENQVSENISFSIRLSNSFKIYFKDFTLLIFIWSITQLYAFCSIYYLPKVLDSSFFNKINPLFRSKKYKENISYLKASYNRNNFNDCLNQANESCKKLSNIDRIPKEVLNNHISFINSIKSIKNNIRTEDNAELKNRIMSHHYSFVKQDNKILHNLNEDNNNDENDNNINISNRMITDKTNDDNNYIPYSEKYIKIIIAESISLVGYTLLSFLVFTYLKRKYLLIVFISICCIFSFCKIISLQNVEYLTAILRFCGKFSLNIAKIYTSENFHTDYRYTIYIFCGFISRSIIMVGPFIVDGLFSISIYAPNYFEISLCLLGVLFISFLTTDNPEDSEIDSIKKLYSFKNTDNENFKKDNLANEQGDEIKN